MAVVVQNDTGEVEGANSYQSIADFRAYHGAVGTPLTDFTDLKIEYALIKATRYLDIRHRYIGRKLFEEQVTEWPRRYTDWEFNRVFHRIHPEIVKATAEIALRALVAELLPDPSRDSGGRRLKRQEYEIEGVIRENAEFVENSDFELPEYRSADLALERARVIIHGSEVIRG